VTSWGETADVRNRGMQAYSMETWHPNIVIIEAYVCPVYFPAPIDYPCGPG
jgi:hypothetical protein